MDLKRLVTLLCILSLSVCFSQTDIKRSKKAFRQAEKYFERADYLKAFRSYTASFQYDTSNYKALYRSGLSLFNISRSDSNAAYYFFKSKGRVPEAHFYLGRIHQLNGHCEQALAEFNHFKTINQEGIIPDTELSGWIKKCEETLVGETEKGNYTVKNLGSDINTKYPEYVPLIWKLNNSLIFTSRREGPKRNAVDPYGRYYEDIYISRKTGQRWSAPVPLSDTLNTETHDACVAFSPKTNELIIYRTDEQKTGGDLYSTEYSNGSWSVPVKLGNEINSEYLEASACFSDNGNEILFSSNRPGGYGGKDLYRVVRFLNGKYSLPKNLGPEINTAEDEDAPYVDKYDKTLYFSSRGHNSIGEYDIFKCAYDGGKDAWEKPVNLGQPVNSTHDDIYFIKHDDANTAYFTSRREGGYGDADIYEVNFSEPQKIIVYCAIKTDLSPGELKDLEISLFDHKTGNLEGLYQPNTQYMSIVLLVRKNNLYDIKVEGDHINTVEKQWLFDANTREITIETSKKTN